MTEDTPSWLALIPVIFISPCLLLWKERTFTKQTLENIPFPPVAPYADSMKADGTRHRLSCYPVFPNAACPRRLCQPPWTQLSLSETRHLSGGTTYAEAHKPNASRSSGEGVWGRGASLREAASPPESPHRKSLREGARGRGLLYQRSPLPRKSSITPDTRSGSASASANCRGTCRRGSWSPSNAGGPRPSRDRRSTRQCRPRGGARSHRGRQRGSHG